jgi:NAD(P)-dependent dehydrogenase (short-subunit alcohol dehydrogenase family)
MGMNVIVTGASGGFGRLIVEQLVSEGHNVVATMRDVQGRNGGLVGPLESLGATVVEMDVTSEASVETGIAHAVGALSSIDVVVNNAGVGVLGLQESFTPDDWKRVFEVNLFGIQRVCRAVLPHMRERGCGLIVNISSLLGRMSIPFYGPYIASKWALEALSENYRCELSQSGIEVCIVEPGGFPTTFIGNLLRPSDGDRSLSYGAFGQMPEGFLKGFEAALAANPTQDPHNVAKAVAVLIAMPRGEKPFRTVIDAMGMGEHVERYNEHLRDVTTGIYQSFGIGHLLSLPK